VGSDEDNGNADVGFAQLTLKIDSADAWQSHVEDQATRKLRTVCCEIFEGGSECFDWQANRSQ
jgi:hypothetical protein